MKGNNLNKIKEKYFKVGMRELFKYIKKWSKIYRKKLKIFKSRT